MQPLRPGHLESAGRRSAGTLLAYAPRSNAPDRGPVPRCPCFAASAVVGLRAPPRSRSAPPAAATAATHRPSTRGPGDSDHPLAQGGVEQVQGHLGREHGAAQVHQHDDTRRRGPSRAIAVGDRGGVGAEGVVRRGRPRRSIGTSVAGTICAGELERRPRPAAGCARRPRSRPATPPVAFTARQRLPPPRRRSRAVDVAPGSWCPRCARPGSWPGPCGPQRDGGVAARVAPPPRPPQRVAEAGAVGRAPRPARRRPGPARRPSSCRRARPCRGRPPRPARPAAPPANAGGVELGSVARPSVAHPQEERAVQRPAGTADRADQRHPGRLEQRRRRGVRGGVELARPRRSCRGACSCRGRRRRSPSRARSARPRSPSRRRANARSQRPSSADAHRAPPCSRSDPPPQRRGVDRGVPQPQQLVVQP